MVHESDPPMASERQIAANRLNAQKSTGPRSPEGKAAVSQNALKHGLRSKYFLRGFAEEKEDYLQLYAGLYEEWQPATRTEEVLLERMALALWKSAYMESVESMQLLTWGDYKSLAHIWPQQARLERSYDKALAQLRALQQDSAGKSWTEPVAAPEPPSPVTLPVETTTGPAAVEASSNVPPNTAPLPVASRSTVPLVSPRIIGFVCSKNPPAVPPAPGKCPAPVRLTHSSGHSGVPSPEWAGGPCQDPENVLQTLALHRVARFDTRPPQVLNV